MDRTLFNDTYCRHVGTWSEWIDRISKKIGEAPYELSLIWTSVMKHVRPKRRRLLTTSRPLMTRLVRQNHGYILTSEDGNVVYMYLKMAEEKALCLDALGNAHEWTDWNDTTRWPWFQRYSDQITLYNGVAWAAIARYTFDASPSYAIQCGRMPVSKAWMSIWDSCQSRVMWMRLLTQARFPLSPTPLLVFVRELDRFTKWLSKRRVMSYEMHQIVDRSLYPWRYFALAAGWDGAGGVRVDRCNITFLDSGEAYVHCFRCAWSDFMIYTLKKQGQSEIFEVNVSLTFNNLLHPTWRLRN